MYGPVICYVSCKKHTKESERVIIYDEHLSSVMEDK